MSEKLERGDPFIFMKVGVHAKEDLISIIKRKRAEIANAGVTFWGYGGNTCHPLTAVQPFAKGVDANGGVVRLLMEEINSKHFAEPVRAESFSEDGINWKPVPQPINVLGSRYALVLGNLDDIDISVSLGDTRVGVGRLEGKTGSDYIRGHVDKACLVYTPDNRLTPNTAVKLRLSARLVAPYAVLLK